MIVSAIITSQKTSAEMNSRLFDTFGWHGIIRFVPIPFKYLLTLFKTVLKWIKPSLKLTIVNKVAYSYVKNLF